MAARLARDATGEAGVTEPACRLSGRKFIIPIPQSTVI